MTYNMETASQFKDLTDFLAKHVSKNDRITHTRIGSKDHNIFGGSYSIPPAELQTFYGLYYESVFVKKRKEYLTEKQLDECSPMAVDFDFRYSYDVEIRQHTKEHIQDMILLYIEELKEYFVFEENKPFDIFIYEKPNVNRLEDKSATKDGIHMLINIQVDHVIQMMIRENIMSKLEDAWSDIGFKPELTWDKILDEGISKGVTNWQLFGSRKPANEAYELTQHFVITYDSADKEFMMDEKSISDRDFDMKKNFAKMSVQNDKNPKFAMNPKIVEAYNKRKGQKKLKQKKPSNSKTKVNLLLCDDEEDGFDAEISIDEIKCKDSLNKAMESILKKLTPQEYIVKETHDYTQTLPEKYYEPGSHLLNTKVAFALKGADERLFLSWVMLRSKASDFDYDSIPDLYNRWKKHFNVSKKDITIRSIMYWSRQDAYDEYMKVKNSTVEYFMEESLKCALEFDIARVLFHMYKDKYVCTSIKSDTWYIFKNHKWEVDKGMTLRLAVSTELYKLYDDKREEVMNEWQHYEQNEDNDKHEFLKKKASSISGLLIKLKKTSDKNNIIREAKELFYDGQFSINMDANKYLLCFKNGVVDFTTNTFRNGFPQDYITKTTGIDYHSYDESNKDMKEIGDQVINFMETLFPINDLNSYMWDHLASCLIGVNKNQTFNVYHGSGSNGKSMLADLMSHSLGEYKATVPITLVTEKRTSIGGTSSEVMQLKGIRYAVMQEPSKGVRLNEGIMKELTGGDPLQARALFQESETFMPQFKLVVCTNNLFDIDSNDDGTWRRIRKCNFLSKFVDEKEMKNHEDTQHVFKKDKSLNEKIPSFAPVFVSMLVKRAFKTGGNVEDCETITEASNKYRKGQDHISAFVNDRIEKSESKNDKIGKVNLYQEFKLWFQQEQGVGRKMPKGEELYSYMEKKFGQYKNGNGWRGIKFILNEEVDDIAEMEN